MSYTKTTWSNGDVISAAKLNNAEGGIEANDLAISDLKSDLGDLDDLETTDKSSIVAAINEAAQSGGSGALTQDTKQALLQCFAHTAWTDVHGQDYYDDLEDALYHFDLLSTISAVYTQSGTVYDTDSLDSLKADLVVTGTYSDGTYNTIRNYTLSGTLTVGTSTVTVTYGGKTTTFNVTVSQAAATLASISAAYTQSGTVYDTDSLDSLKTDLVVTAHYSDSTTATVPATDYTLSGTLAEGTSTITVSYGGKTDTFSVAVTHDDSADWDYIWRYTDGLPSASDWTWQTGGGSGQVHEITSDGMLMTAKNGTNARYYMPYAPSQILNAGGGIAEFTLYIPDYSGGINDLTKVHFFDLVVSDGTNTLAVMFTHPFNMSGATNIYLYNGSDWYSGTLVDAFSYETPVTVKLEINSSTSIGKVYVDGVLKADNVALTSISDTNQLRMFAGGIPVTDGGGAVVQSVKVKYGLA